MSLARSRSWTYPSGCSTPRSPEWNQPPRKASSVASGFLKYPSMTPSPRITTSPMVVPSAGTGAMSGSTTATSPTSGMATPWRAITWARSRRDMPAQSGCGSQMVKGPWVSVSP